MGTETESFQEMVARFGRTADIVTASWVCRCKCGSTGVWVWENGFLCVDCGYGRGTVVKVLRRLGEPR